MAEQTSLNVKLPIVDAHIHVYDSTANVHRFLDQADPTFQALVGDYSSAAQS